MKATSLKNWCWIHKWTSLICTVFMFILCLTGLPLIFHQEIEHFLGTETVAPNLPSDHPRVSLDTIIRTAEKEHTGYAALFASQEADDDRVWYITLAQDPQSYEHLQQVAIDARTGDILNKPALDHGFMYIIRSLHIDFFAGLSGTLFLGCMAFLLILAIISGVVIYAPFMRDRSFGTIRSQQTSGKKWLDLHNLSGMIIAAWLLVVGATGMINTWADLIVPYWQHKALATITTPYQGQAIPKEFSSIQLALERVQAKVPNTSVQFIAFPGTSFSSPYHYGIFMRGNEALSAKLVTPVLVNSHRSEIDAVLEAPWYLKTLLLSQPLHFGDYGGFLMQIIWAFFDLLALLVLGSGLYLWVKKYYLSQKK